MEFTSKNLTFIIVTFNSKKVIFNCLNSLPKDFHKIIIENSSDQELKKELEQNYVNTRVILSDNIGMGAGNNLGIKKTKTQFAYVLNPDVVLREDTLFNINNSISRLENFAILSPISDDLNYPNYKTFNKNDLDKNNLIGNVEEIAQQMVERFDPDDRIMAWFDFFNHDSKRVCRNMTAYMDKVAPMVEKLLEGK